MAINPNNFTVHVNVEKKVVEQFEKLYPRCRSRFIQNAMIVAIQDKGLFDRIFFKDLVPRL